jgi:hypothetical protein
MAPVPPNSSEGAKRNSSAGAIAFCMNAVAGAVIWEASLRFTGEREPWDSDGALYLGAMLCVGFVGGVLAPRRLWLSFVGMYAGQFVGTLLVTQKMGPLASLGWSCFLPFYCLTTLAGAAVGAVLNMTVTATLAQRNGNDQKSAK